MAYCSRCNRYFGSENALKQHEDNSGSHNICDDCGIDFTTSQALINHYVGSPMHDYCQMCDEHFDDEDELEEHYEDEHYYCSLCSKFFRAQQGLNDHNRQKHGGSRKARLRACPGRGCTKSFVTYADLTQHLESGACRSKSNRAVINSLAVKLDHNRVVTNASRLLTGPNGFMARPLIMQSYATERSYNGSDYECILCRRTYKTLDRLNQHLNSPAHDDEIYQCPKRYGGCGGDFRTLSGLMQHAESGSCNIHKYQDQVNRALDNITSRIGRIGFK